MKAYQIRNSLNCEIAVVSEEELDALRADGTLRPDDTVIEVEVED